MKLKYAYTGVIAALLCLRSHSLAATVTVNNLGTDGTDLALTNSVGVPIMGGTSSGFYALFVFGSETAPSAPTTASQLQANKNAGLLQQFGITPGNSPGGGAFEVQFSFTNIANANLFFVIGNGTNVESSTELALVDIQNPTLTGNDSPFSQDLGTYRLRASDVGVGTVDFDPPAPFNYSTTTGDPAYDTFSLSLAVVPEPSGVMLGGLGVLIGLVGVRRRRN